MNTQKIQAGMLVKNYKQMCALLDEEVKNGRSKQFQLKNWSRYFSYHRIEKSTAYVVDEIYAEPYPEEEFRKDVVYSKLIQYILAERLSLEDIYEIDLTKRQLYLFLGLVNENYVGEVNKQIALDNFCHKHNDSLTTAQAYYYYNDFSMYTSRRLDGIVEAALQSMEERMLIVRNTKYNIVEKKYVNGNLVEEKRTATNKDISTILNITFEYLQEHPEFTYLNAYNYKKYYNGLNAKFQEEQGWNSVYKSTEIVFSSDSMKKYAQLIGEELLEECQKNLTNLNETVVERFTTHFVNKYDKNRNNMLEKAKSTMKIIPSKWTDEDLINNVIKHNDILMHDLLNDNYVDIQKEFIDLFINAHGKFNLSYKNNEKINT